MWDRLIRNWMYGGFLAGLLLIALLPLVRGCSAVVMATYLLLPAYMIHQYEEHDNDRFRLFMNRKLGRGMDVLTPAAVFVINIPGVWGVIALSLWLTLFSRSGFALIPVYLVLLNALVHIIGVIAFRGYNPGLATAIVLFLPLGVHALWEVQRSGGGTPAMHICGLVTSIAIHAALVIYFKRRQVLLEREPARG